MDIYDLQPDEIQHELDVRFIPTNDKNGLDQLCNLVRSEINNSRAKPAKMSKSAAKRPDIEITTCRAKLSELKNLIINLEHLETDEVLPSANKLYSRLVHVQERLQRAETSNTYEPEAKKALLACVVYPCLIIILLLIMYNVFLYTISP